MSKTLQHSNASADGYDRSAGATHNVDREFHRTKHDGRVCTLLYAHSPMYIVHTYMKQILLCKRTTSH